jgi:hypothetical protein
MKQMKPTLTLFTALFLAPLAALPDPQPKQVQVGVYYFPNWGPVAHSEWKAITAAKPRFEGHAQPKIPSGAMRTRMIRS